MYHLRLGFFFCVCFFFQAEDGIRDLVRSRGLGDVYKRHGLSDVGGGQHPLHNKLIGAPVPDPQDGGAEEYALSLIHI